MPVQKRNRVTSQNNGCLLLGQMVCYWGKWYCSCNLFSCKVIKEKDLKSMYVVEKEQEKSANRAFGKAG